MIFRPLNSEHSRRSHPRVPVSRVAAAWSVTLLTVLLTGCATGDYAYVATIAGGEKLRIPLERGGAVLTKEGGIQILSATGDVNVEKRQLYYKFAFSDQNDRPLRSVVVDDVSEETAVTIIDDSQPQLNARRWDKISRFFDRDEPSVKWVFYVGDSFRVYRFTIIFSDGQKIVLYQGSRVPGWAKTGIRTLFGEKY